MEAAELDAPVDADADDDETVETVETEGRQQRSPIMEALEELGPSTAREIARHIGRETGNVSTRLRQMEEEGRVRRTGRSTSEPGQRGGPSIEWEKMPPGGEQTGPGVSMTGPGPVDLRLQRMAERIGSLSASLERAEAELEGAKARADQAEARARAAEERRQDAERRAGRVTHYETEVARLEARVEELEAEGQELQRQVIEAGQDAEAMAGDRNLSQSELDDLAELLGLPLNGDHGAIVERVRELAAKAEEFGTVEGCLVSPEERGPGAVYRRVQETLAELRAGGGRSLIPTESDDRQQMRRSYFDLLLEMAGREGTEEHVFDRLERLVDETHERED